MSAAQTHDAMVVGAGLAGLAAAAALAEQQLDVLVVEKQQDVGGSTLMSGGWFAWSDTPEQRRLGIQDSDAIFVRDMQRTARGHADDVLLQAYVDLQREADEWARRRLDVTYDVVKLSSGQTVPRSHHADIRAMTTRLVSILESSPNVELRTKTAARRIESGAGGAVTTLQVEGPEGPFDCHVRAGVVLTSGGFSRSRQLLTLFVPKQLQALPYGGLGCTGDGLLMAWRLGAGLRDVGWVSGTFGSHPDTTDEEHELLTAFYMGAIIVNRQGRRFVDESLTYKEIGQVCLDQPNGLGFEVFDQRIRDRSQPGVPLSDIDHLQAKGHVHQADTLEELAAAAGIDKVQLLATIERYNRSTIGQGEDEFGRTSLCNGVGRLDPLDTPPYYAYPARTLMTSTYGGLSVSPEAEVLDIEGSPLPGLFAAGEVVGGFHGASYLTGTALGKALIFGRRAANRLATGR